MLVREGKQALMDSVIDTAAILTGCHIALLNGPPPDPVELVEADLAALEANFPDYARAATTLTRHVASDGEDILMSTVETFTPGVDTTTPPDPSPYPQAIVAAVLLDLNDNVLEYWTLDPPVNVMEGVPFHVTAVMKLEDPIERIEAFGP